MKHSEIPFSHRRPGGGLLHTFRTLLPTVLFLAGLTACGIPAAAPASRASEDAMMQAELASPPALSFTVPDRPPAILNGWTGHNRASLSVGPLQNSRLILSLIASARKSLRIEVFNFADDPFGQRIVQALVAARRRGVDVTVISDYLGSRFKGGKRVRENLEKAGVRFQFYEPRLIRQDNQMRGINIDHRKVYLADQDRAIIGGVNLMSEFDTTVHDALLDLSGDVVPQLHDEFLRDWKLAGGGSLPALPERSGVPLEDVALRVVVTSPPEGRFEAKLALYEAIEGARRSIDIEQQYFWDEGVIQRTVAAARRGVKVRVIVPGESDEALFRKLHVVGLNRILQAGGQARLYRGIPDQAHVHTKFFSIDGTLAALGSVNADTRALIDNQEIALLTTDPALIREFHARLFEPDWEHATVVYEYNDSRIYRGPFLRLWQILQYYT